MADTSEDQISLLIQDVVAAAQIPARLRGASIKPTVSRLTSLMYEHGLSSDALQQIVELVTKPNQLDQASTAALVRSLYPRQLIPEDIVLSVVGALAIGGLKPALAIQAALLRWLILVYHVLEDRSILARAYSVLFNLLDTDIIRPWLAHLLALITRRKHVRPFRIQALLALSRQTGNDPSLVGLLRVFKDYYPEIIVGEAVRGKASAFKHPDPAWRQRLDEIQHAHRQAAQGATEHQKDFRVYRNANRSGRNKLIPSVHTSYAKEDSVTLEEIENVSSLVQNIEKLDLPNQLVAVLADPLLQKLLLLRPSSDSYRRVANWLGSVLQDAVDGDVDEDTLWEVLQVVKEFVIQTREVPPILLDFFMRFLQIWDGSGRRQLVLDILAFVPLIEFDELYRHILMPLETAMRDNEPGTLESILKLYTGILHHWTVLCKSADSIPTQANEAITSLIRHVNDLALTLLQTFAGVSSECAVLTFYEQVERLVTDQDLQQHIRIELPNKLLVYMLLFSDSLASVSRLCFILARYKKGFEAAMAARSGKRRSKALWYDRAYINLYNGFLMDICNCFWRGQAFSDDDTNARGCMIPRSTVSALTAYVAAVEPSFSLASLFSLSHAPLLCLQSIECLRELETVSLQQEGLNSRHAGPVTQSSLAKLAAAGGLKISWQEYRINVLRALSDYGFSGVTELLKSTMRVLKSSMEAIPGSQESNTQGQGSQRLSLLSVSSQ
ncbi:hypothetical protein CDD81_3383 [Ophiocordyceps australis]|uniref:Mis6 domain-containing protein n=1 Tax=Ophiocordyceps australis TaxID=1399860 RepID=A0A2C5XX80_9HYPO|nr:hypothetical protein CDD81_3383 [Ophiocordyceps australis]